MVLSNRLRLRESYKEIIIEVTMRHCIFVERHAKISNCFQLFIFKYFSRCSSNRVFLSIKMFDSSRNSSQSLKKTDLFDDY